MNTCHDSGIEAPVYWVGSIDLKPFLDTNFVWIPTVLGVWFFRLQLICPLHCQQVCLSSFAGTAAPIRIPRVPSEAVGVPGWLRAGGAAPGPGGARHRGQRCLGKHLKAASVFALLLSLFLLLFRDPQDGGFFWSFPVTPCNKWGTFFFSVSL